MAVRKVRPKVYRTLGGKATSKRFEDAFMGGYKKKVDAVKIIEELLEVLPDTVREENCWDWCWSTLSCKCQKMVKDARINALEFLKTHKEG